MIFSLPSLNDYNTIQVMAGSAILGITCGVIGTFSVLRGRALLGDTLAHAALPGLCLVFLLIGGKNIPLFLLGAFISGLVGILAVTLIRNFSRLKDDTALALVLGTFFGFGITLSRIIQNKPGGNRAGLDGYILGKAASMSSIDVTIIAIAAIITISIVVALFKEFTVICFDESFSRTIPLPVKRLDLLLMSLVALCTVVGLPAVGVVLIAAMLIIPGVSARYWSDRLSIVVPLAGFFGGAAAVAGVLISASVSFSQESHALPTGPAIVLCATSIFSLSLLFAPKRGVLATLLTQKRVRESIKR